MISIVHSLCWRNTEETVLWLSPLGEQGKLIEFPHLLSGLHVSIKYVWWRDSSMARAQHMMWKHKDLSLNTRNTHKTKTVVGVPVLLQWDGRQKQETLQMPVGQLDWPELCHTTKGVYLKQVRSVVGTATPGIMTNSSLHINKHICRAGGDNERDMFGLNNSSTVLSTYVLLVMFMLPHWDLPLCNAKKCHKTTILTVHWCDKLGTVSTFAINAEFALKQAWLGLLSASPGTWTDLITQVVTQNPFHPEIPKPIHFIHQWGPSFVRIDMMWL